MAGPTASERWSRGKFADMIAVQGDPMTNVRVLENVQFVMKGGEVKVQDSVQSTVAQRIARGALTLC